MASTGDRRVDRTKRLLQEALLELVHERSYDRITVQDILDRADVGRSTFYAHFRNKDELLLGDLGRNLTAGPLRMGSCDLFEHLRDNYDLYPALAGTGGLDAVFRRLRQSLLDSWQRRLSGNGEPRGDGDARARIARHFLAGGVMEVIDWWLRSRMPCGPEQLSRMLEPLIAAALAAAGDPAGSRGGR